MILEFCCLMSTVTGGQTDPSGNGTLGHWLRFDCFLITQYAFPIYFTERQRQSDLTFYLLKNVR